MDLLHLRLRWIQCYDKAIYSALYIISQRFLYTGSIASLFCGISLRRDMTCRLLATRLALQTKRELLLETL